MDGMLRVLTPVNKLVTLDIITRRGVRPMHTSQPGGTIWCLFVNKTGSQLE